MGKILAIKLTKSLSLHWFCILPFVVDLALKIWDTASYLQNFFWYRKLVDLDLVMKGLSSILEGVMNSCQFRQSAYGNSCGESSWRGRGPHTEAGSPSALSVIINLHGD